MIRVEFTPEEVEALLDPVGPRMTGDRFDWADRCESGRAKMLQALKVERHSGGSHPESDGPEACTVPGHYWEPVRGEVYKVR
jgi:hypothetical protein